MNDDGEIIGVAITNPGGGYTSAPTIAFAGGSGATGLVNTTLGRWVAKWIEVNVNVNGDCTWYQAVFATQPYKKI